MTLSAELRQRIIALDRTVRQQSGRRPPHRGSQCQDGHSLTPDEVEFALALDLYKRHHRRPFPTCSEVLLVARALGYSKPSLPEGVPCPENQQTSSSSTTPSLSTNP